PAVRADGAAITRRLAHQPGVDNVVSYWSFGGIDSLRSTDGREALVLGRIEGNDDQVRSRIRTIAPRYTFSDGRVRVAVGGRAEVFHQVSTQVETDLQRAEKLSIPIT